MPNSTTERAKLKPKKPSKPYPGFPLFPHQTRRWAKKIRGKTHYFGPWHDAQGALTRYLAVKDDLFAGRTPRPATDGRTVADLVSEFLSFKSRRMEAGEIVRRTWQDYHAACEIVVREFGDNRLVEDLRPDDFEGLRETLAERNGPVSLGNLVGRCRAIFRFAHLQGLIERPVLFGMSFRKPSAKTLRIERAKNGQANGKRMFEAAELQTILGAAPQPLQAMILLAANGGLGQSDCSGLTLGTVEKAIATGWLDCPRVKTGIDRRIPLWAETVESLAEAIAVRPEPKDAADASLAFLTRCGQRWVKPTGDDAVAKEFSKLLKKLALKRQRINFYAIRHTFRTVADSSRDQPAVDYLMGHARNDMASLYREGIGDDRLEAVVAHVHRWLYEECDD